MDLPGTYPATPGSWRADSYRGSFQQPQQPTNTQADSPVGMNNSTPSKPSTMIDSQHEPQSKQQQGSKDMVTSAAPVPPHTTMMPGAESEHEQQKHQKQMGVNDMATSAVPVPPHTTMMPGAESAHEQQKHQEQRESKDMVTSAVPVPPHTTVMPGTESAHEQQKHQEQRGSKDMVTSAVPVPPHTTIMPGAESAHEQQKHQEPLQLPEKAAMSTDGNKCPSHMTSMSTLPQPVQPTRSFGPLPIATGGGIYNTVLGHGSVREDHEMKRKHLLPLGHKDRHDESVTAALATPSAPATEVTAGGVDNTAMGHGSRDAEGYTRQGTATTVIGRPAASDNDEKDEKEGPVAAGAATVVPRAAALAGKNKHDKNGTATNSKKEGSYAAEKGKKVKEKPEDNGKEEKGGFFHIFRRRHGKERHHKKKDARRHDGDNNSSSSGHAKLVKEPHGHHTRHSMMVPPVSEKQQKDHQGEVKAQHREAMVVIEPGTGENSRGTATAFVPDARDAKNPMETSQAPAPSSAPINKEKLLRPKDKNKPTVHEADSKRDSAVSVATTDAAIATGAGGPEAKARSNLEETGPVPATDKTAAATQESWSEAQMQTQTSTPAAANAGDGGMYNILPSGTPSGVRVRAGISMHVANR